MAPLPPPPPDPLLSLNKLSKLNFVKSTSLLNTKVKSLGGLWDMWITQRKNFFLPLKNSFQRQITETPLDIKVFISFAIGGLFHTHRLRNLDGNKEAHMHMTYTLYCVKIRYF